MANPNPVSPWKPGQSGNPAGRPPKEYSITETMRDMMRAKPDIKAALATKILEQALQGDSAAQKMIWGYMDGMPTQPIENKIIAPELDVEAVSQIDTLMKGDVKTETTT